LKYVYYKFVEGLCQRIKSENEEGSGECWRKFFSILRDF
jgi:hypothetical protein